MWDRLGHPPTVALAGWPTVDPALLVQDSVTCVVQVGGKIRERLEVSPNISQEDLQALAMASAEVKKSIGDSAIKNIIVRAPKLVNIVI